MPPGWVTRCQCHLVAAASGSRCHMPGTSRHPWSESRDLYPRHLCLLSGCPCPHGSHSSSLAGVPMGSVVLDCLGVPMAPTIPISLVSPWDPWLWAVWVSPWHPQLQPGWCPHGIHGLGQLNKHPHSGLCWAAPGDMETGIYEGRMDLGAS